NFARNEAIRLHASVDVVPVDEDWSRGWTIQVRESEAVIRRDGPLARDIAPMRAEAIGFLRNGLVRGEGAPTQSLQLASSSTAARLHCVEFRVTGAPIMRVDKDGDGRCDVD
ncbi:MAG: GspH/FimT family protein, partial [Rhodocyclaceae bacterium]|nr:GspH/FimT family protein [Rhodocyclaceae bacterium]